jgi:hypothetical protein
MLLWVWRVFQLIFMAFSSFLTVFVVFPIYKTWASFFLFIIDDENCKIKVKTCSLIIRKLIWKISSYFLFSDFSFKEVLNNQFLIFYLFLLASTAASHFSRIVLCTFIVICVWFLEDISWRVSWRLFHNAGLSFRV